MKILLLDDHTLFRESLRRLLEGSSEWQVIGEFGTSATALAAVRQGLDVDLALIDFELDPGGAKGRDGLAAAAQLRKFDPQLPILMVTAGLPVKQLTYAVREARVGIFLKSEPSEELFLAMRRTARGEMWLSSAAALALIEEASVPSDAPSTEISDRERSVLNMLLEGLSNKEMATRIGISEGTVKGVMQSLFSKAGVRSRSQLVHFAIGLQEGSARY